MVSPPSLRRVPACPITAGVIILAVVATIAYLVRPQTFEAFSMNWFAWHGQPWRLVTSAFLHADPIHLLFNVYWLWVFGAAFECRFGHARTLLLMLGLAVVSSAAEDAISVPGIGLSGVGYGLFGAAWIIQRRDEKFTRVVDSGTVKLFLLWGLGCVAATLAGVYRVANVAHASGLVLGGLIGLATSYSRNYWVAVATGSAIALLAASVGRPWIKRAPADRALDCAFAGQSKEAAGDFQAAARLFEDAVRLDAKTPFYRAHLANAYHHLGRMVEARRSYWDACDLGEAFSCRNVGIALELGIGGGKDIRAAQDFYRKACDRGHKGACDDWYRVINTPR